MNRSKSSSEVSSQSLSSSFSLEHDKKKKVDLVPAVAVNERKINCLIVNDEEFTLLIINTMLNGLKFIGRVDQASNG